MRLFSQVDEILLDPSPCTAAELRSKTKYKMRCRRYVEGERGGLLVLKSLGNYEEFEKVCDRFGVLAESVGCSLEVDPSLTGDFQQIKELAEERSRLGSELKAGVHKFDGQLAEFSQVVDHAMVRPLKDRQMRDAFFLAAMGRAGNFSVPGSGKTATVLGAFSFLAARGMVDRIMVVCPKNAFDSWRYEWVACFGDKWPLDCFSTQDADYLKSNSGRSDRKRYIRTRIGSKNLLLVNYEAAVGVADALAQVASARTLLVFDEIHRVKKVGGKQAAAALAISAEAPYTFALTGTPLPNSYLDLYNFLHILYPHEYENFFGFEKNERQKADNFDQDRINQKISPFYCRTTKRDLGVPPAEPDEIVEIDADYRTEKLLNVLKSYYGTGKRKFTLLLRVLQMENDPLDLLEHIDPQMFKWVLEEREDDFGTTYESVDYSDEIVDMIKAASSPKRMRCVELVRSIVEKGRPVIIWTIFIKSMCDLKSMLAAYGIEARTINGEDNLESRSADLDDFRAGKYPVLITNPHTLAESVSLHSVCHDAVYYEYSFNLVHLLQSADRIHRLGLPQDQATRYYYLVENYMLLDGNEWSLDQEIYDRLMLKKETMLRAIDQTQIEIQPTTQEDLDAIFAGLFA